MPFRMRFWSKEKIDLVDTQGGRDWQIFDGSLQQIDHAGVPLKGTDNGILQSYLWFRGILPLLWNRSECCSTCSMLTAQGIWSYLGILQD